MAYDYGAIYDVQRKRAATDEAANLQTQKGALARRAAQLGGGPSGALIKQENLAADASAKRLGGAVEGINAAQAHEEGGRAFTTSERVAGQEFAQNERQIHDANLEKQQKYAYQESAAAREQQAQQFNKQLKFEEAKFRHEKYIDKKNLTMAAQVQAANEKQSGFDKLFSDPGKTAFSTVVAGPVGAAADIGKKLMG